MANNITKSIHLFTISSGPPSPESMSRENVLHALGVPRTLWSMYNQSPPRSVNATSSPKHEPQREALNLAESPPHPIKREREVDYDRESDEYGLPMSKKVMQQLHSQLQQSHLSAHNKLHRRRSSTPPGLNHHNRSDSDRDRSDRSDHHHNSSSRRRLSASPPHHANGTNTSSLNGSSDLLNACSPITLLSGMQFKLSSRGKCSLGV